jgi:hypothetical protein
MAQREQANVPLLLTIGAVSGLLLIVLAEGVQAWFLREVQHEVAEKWDTQPVQPLTDMKLAQLKNINTYHWVDKNSQTVAVPIEQAMKMVVENKGAPAATQPAK